MGISVHGEWVCLAAAVPLSPHLPCPEAAVPLSRCRGVTVDLVDVAQAATIPFDTTKVRMQIRNNATSAAAAATAAPGAGAPPGFVGTLTHIAKTEGAGALFRGLTPGLQRQLLFGSIRLGLYEPVRGAASDRPVCACVHRACVVWVLACVRICVWVVVGILIIYYKPHMCVDSVERTPHPTHVRTCLSPRSHPH